VSYFASRIAASILFTVGFVLLGHLLTYLLQMKWYERGNIDKEKTQSFEVNKFLFTHRYVKVIYAVVGTVCIVCSIILFITH
jgi:hypothetical protein